jgi:hypothetical protein
MMAYEMKKYTYTTPKGRKPWFCITYLEHWQLYGTDEMVEEVIKWMYDALVVIQKANSKQYKQTEIDLGDHLHSVVMYIPFDGSLEDKRSFLISQNGMTTIATIQLAMKYAEVLDTIIK